MVHHVQRCKRHGFPNNISKEHNSLKMIATLPKTIFGALPASYNPLNVFLQDGIETLTINNNGRGRAVKEHQRRCSG